MGIVAYVFLCEFIVERRVVEKSGEREIILFGRPLQEPNIDDYPMAPWESSRDELWRLIMKNKANTIKPEEFAVLKQHCKFASYERHLGV